jgi:hypothetical protein
MTARAGTQPVSAGVAVTEISGAAPGTDTVPEGCCLLVRNTGAGTHNLVISTSGDTFDGLVISTAAATTPGTREVAVPAGTNTVVRIPASYGDANGQVGFGIKEGTQSEVKYTVIAA